MNNLTELSKKVYQLQIDKGWCKPNEKRDIETLKILILSEAFEAFEAYRKNVYSPSSSSLIPLYSSIDTWGSSHNVIFKEQVKDTFEDEIADVAIRALDLAGYLELDFGDYTLNTLPVYYKLEGDKDQYTKALKVLGNLTLPDTKSKYIWGNYSPSLNLVFNILQWCKEVAYVFNFDLMQHIELKLAYNKTRPFRHGNKVV